MSKAFVESLQSRILFLSAGTLSAPPKKHKDEGSDTQVSFGDLTQRASDYNSSSPEMIAGASQADGTIGFDDLTALAQNYGASAPSISAGSSSFAADWLLSQSLANASMEQGLAGASLDSKGKLTITMGGYNNVTVSASKNVTYVNINTLTRDNVLASTSTYSKAFKSVKSIDLTGSMSDDSITLDGVTRDSVIRARSGKDTITGSAGDSTIYGGAGSDVIYGGGGDDAIYGEAGNDRLYGQAGKDHLDGGKGHNRLAGGSGVDYVAFHEAKDSITRDVKDKLEALT